MMANANKLTALIVDDDSTTVANNTKYLSKNGFRVMVANNGLEAVQMFQGGYTFDLVVMGMEMPIMDGLQATREIRDMGVRTVIIGMSVATSSPEQIDEFVRAGLDDYHAKPMNMAKLASIVDYFN